MTYDDLPQNWPELSLTEPRLVADVLDLMVGPDDRQAGCIAVLACDSGVRLIQPMVIDDAPRACEPDLMRRAVDIVVEALADVERAGTLIIAFGRPDGLSVTADDRAWAAAAVEALEGTAWSLSSAHVVTPAGSRPIPA
jgi:hypothetical protein